MRRGDLRKSLTICIYLVNLRFYFLRVAFGYASEGCDNRAKAVQSAPKCATLTRKSVAYVLTAPLHRPPPGSPALKMMPWHSLPLTPRLPPRFFLLILVVHELSSLQSLASNI